MTRMFDIIFSTVALILLIPLFAVVIAILLLTGEHEAFYLQSRIGIGGKPFHVFKFVTMLRDSPNLEGGYLTRPGDPRVLPVGRILRKWKINELPQFLNVLLGQMSIVGPRPQAAVHYGLYEPSVAKAINTLRPGLTGLGSLMFRDEEGLLERSGQESDYVHDHLITPYKGELEKWYADNRSVYLYFKILILTAFSLIEPTYPFLRFFPGAPVPELHLKALMNQA